MADSFPSLKHPVALEPLPVLRPDPSFQILRRQRRPVFRLKPTSVVALVPLFWAALLYLCGICLARLLYLPPGPLLLSIVAYAAIVLWAIWKAPRLAWLPMMLLWVSLGAWCKEMEREPAADAQLASFASDHLLRTIEGTVVSVEPLRKEQEYDQDSDEAIAAETAEASRQTPRMRQQVDVEVDRVEVIQDTYDRMEALAQGPATRVRMQLLWPSATAMRELACGDRIRVVAQLDSPEIFRDAGVWDRAQYLETLQVSVTASLNAAKTDNGQPRLQVFNPPQRSLHCLLNDWRNRVSSRLQNLPAQSQWLPRWLRISNADAAMLTALLTGDREWLTRGMRVGFERTGSFHLIVVSGLHLAIVAGCIFALGRRLRLNLALTTALTILTAFAYALLTGFGVPVQRSFWMVTLYLFGRLLYRNRSPLNVIGFAILCLAVAHPRSIFDASFQMTILAVTAIAGIAVPLLEPTVQARVQALRDLRTISIDAKLAPKVAAFRVWMRFIAQETEPIWGHGLAWRGLPFVTRISLRAIELIAVTVIVELTLALPMAIYFHRITVYAMPVNLILLPLLGVMLPAAMLLLAVISLSPAASVIPAAFCVLLLHGGTWLARRSGDLAFGDLRIPEPGMMRTAAALAIFTLAVWLIRAAHLYGLPKLRWAGVAALACMAVLAVLPRAVEHPHTALLFEAIDVGQGDALLLITPDGHTLLVDGGGLGLAFLPQRRQAPSSFDTGEDIVSPVLWARDIRRLDVVALTHAHHDHMGGLPAILRNFQPRELWVGDNPLVPAYQELMQQANQLGVEVRKLSVLEEIGLGEARIRVIAPASLYRAGPQPSNNDSLVLQVRYGSQSILLTGDAERGEEESMVPVGDLSSTILKVGHHGSRTSTSPRFLQRVHPQWAVISAGRKNRFGHPRQEILQELQEAHVKTYRTDSNGAVCFVLHQSSVSVDAPCIR